MTTHFPLTVFYDASCPVCRLEMDHLRQRDAAGRLVLVDMSADGFDAGAYGLKHRELDAVIHAIRPDGSVLRGMAVLRLCYDAVGLGWVLRASALPPLRPAFDAGYRLFARHRKRISSVLGPVLSLVRERRLRRTLTRMERCSTGDACAVPGLPAVPARRDTTGSSS